MPEISYIDVNLEDWLRARETPPRSEGHHVSDVVVRLLQAASRKFDHYGKDEAITETRRTMFHLGFTWEDVIAEVLQQQLKADPGALVLPSTEISLDGIAGNPDRVIYGRGLMFADAVSEWRIEETKVTWMSTREILGDPRLILEKPKFAYWVLQLKTYASMISDPEVRRRAFHRNDGNYYDIPDDAFVGHIAPTCILRSLFVNNDYKSFQPAPKCWRIDWSLDELTAHWTMIREFLADEEKDNAHTRSESAASLTTGATGRADADGDAGACPAPDGAGDARAAGSPVRSE